MQSANMFIGDFSVLLIKIKYKKTSDFDSFASFLMA